MRGRYLAIGLCFLLICSVFIPISQGYNNKTDRHQPVSSNFGNGNTLYVGGNGPNNYTKIQDAIDNASDGDTVFVYDDSSPYYENVIVDRAIHLIGEDKANTLITGRGKGDVVFISANNVIINNFTINNNIYCLNNSGIGIVSNKNKIYDNIINSNYQHGISIRNSSSNFIKNNKLSVNRNCGVYIFDSNNNTILDNLMEHNGIGIYLIKSNSNLIIDNTIRFHNILIGIAIQESNYNRITDNIISTNEYGITLDISGSNIINGNRIIDNKEFGIIFWCSNKTIITSNTISNSNLGIFLHGSILNSFIKNNFIDNEKDVFFRNSFLTRWKKNYWNRPRILPKLIFGLILYSIIPGGITSKSPWFNIDWRPALKPYDI